MSKPIKTLNNRLFAIFLASVILLFCGCSNQNTADTNNSTGDASNSAVNSNMENISQETKEELQSGSVLTIPYDVEDYVENAIIVSKNDGLLYGVLNNNGEEIIPIRYDDMEFLNKKDFLIGNSEKLYILAEYEDVYFIFDAQGKEIMRSNNLLSYASSYFPNQNAPYFREAVKVHGDNYSYYSGEIIWYSENTTELTKFESNDKNIIAFSDKGYLKQTYESVYANKNYKYFYAQEFKNYCIYIYDFNHNIINKFENYTYYFSTKRVENELLIYLAKNNPDDITVLHLNSNGETIRTENITYSEYVNKHRNNKPYNLYSSNDTYKLETLEGTAIYDERYYNSFEFQGQNDCVGLMNENNEIMIINSVGKRIIDYGYLSTPTAEDNIKMNIGGQEKTIRYMFEGKNSIIIPISSSTPNHTDIYFFFGD